MPFKTVMRYLLLLLPCLSFNSILLNQQALTAEVLTILNVRQQPSTLADIIAVLNPGTIVYVDGRNENADWLLIHTEESSVQGWVAAGFIRLSHPVRITEEIPVSTLTVQSQSTIQDTSSAMISPLNGSRSIPANAFEIYERGLANGMNSGMFIKIGDSNIAQINFLCNLGRDYYDLGGYSHLQTVIDHFKPSGAFCHDSIAANPRFTTLSVLDPTWAPANRCEPNETPLICEIRHSRPSFAFIYVGSQDLEIIELSDAYTPQLYRDNLGGIVETLSEHGVVPILITFVTSDEYYTDGAPLLNTIIRETARTHQIPLIDIQALTAGYHNHGTEPDGYHLSTPKNGKTDFNGNENNFARTRLELLALELLFVFIQ